MFEVKHVIDSSKQLTRKASPTTSRRRSLTREPYGCCGQCVFHLLSSRYPSCLLVWLNIFESQGRSPNVVGLVLAQQKQAVRRTIGQSGRPHKTKVGSGPKMCSYFRKYFRDGIPDNLLSIPFWTVDVRSYTKRKHTTPWSKRRKQRVLASDQVPRNQSSHQ